MKHVYLAGGCFWGCERYFQLIHGILNTQVGYANGNTSETSYKDVCNNSGHAETVKLEYDDNIISLEEILELYYRIIDPTSINKQGNDVGIQYRTGIYYDDLSQKELIKKSLCRLAKSINQNISVECCKLNHFIPAEEYHQSYLYKNPSGYCHINLKEFEYAKNYVPRRIYEKQ